MHTACVPSDGRPGHYNQSLGIISALPAGEQSHQIVALPSPRRSLKRPALVGATLFRKNPRMLRLLFRLYYRMEPPAPGNCRLIISTGGDTLLANIIISHLHNMPNIFIGKRSWFTDRNIDRLFTIEGAPIENRVVVLDFGPVNVPIIPPQNRKNPPALVAVLIGGDSNEYHYSPEDYIQLADALNQLCAKQGLRLLLTTSRRTGPAGESMLRKHIAPQYLADATWYGAAPRPVIQEYCLQADAILCSEDSGTMLAEAICYGTPVFSFHPARRQVTGFYQRFLHRLAGRQVIFLDIPGLTSLNITNAPHAIPPNTTAITKALHELLHPQTATPTKIP